MARNRKKTHYQIDQTLRLTTIITLPSCVGFLVLASPLMVLLYNDAGKVPAQLLMLGSVVIILYGWSTIIELFIFSGKKRGSGIGRSSGSACFNAHSV